MTVVRNVNPSCKMLPFLQKASVAQSPLLISSCLKTLSSFYVIRVFSSPWDVSAVHHCQTGNNNDNTQKKLPFPRLPSLPHSFWQKGLINPEKPSVLLHWFAATDGQRAASSPHFDWRHCLIQAQMSGSEHWLLTKTKINQAHSGSGFSVRLPVAVMWRITWKIDLTASQSLCQYWDQRVCYKQIIDPIIDFSCSQWQLTEQPQVKT